MMNTIYKCIHTGQYLSKWHGGYYIHPLEQADSSLCYDLDINDLFEACEEVGTNFQEVKIVNKI